MHSKQDAAAEKDRRISFPKLKFFFFSVNLHNKKNNLYVSSSFFWLL